MREGYLQLILPGESSLRLDTVLGDALLDVSVVRLNSLDDVSAGPLLFAAATGESGINIALYQQLQTMRLSGGLLEGCIGGMVIDGEGELYTKSTAQQLLLAANACGCTFPGKPLVEATGSLQNFAVLAHNAHTDTSSAYRQSVQQLAQRVLQYKQPKIKRPKLLVLYTSNRSTSNTLMLWGMVRDALGTAVETKEIQLRNGGVADCEGCSYTTCLHLGEHGRCFYGGVIVEEVYPSLLECDALVLLCPNYNDAADANITAFINRMTALFRSNSFFEKSLFGIVVSGYSGGDIVAKQLLSGLCMNKAFQLPPYFCMMETANDPGSILHAPGIGARAQAFAEHMLRHLQGEAKDNLVQ